MPARTNAEVLRDSYEAFTRGDLHPLLDLLSDDVEWVDSTLGPLAGTYRGKGEVPRFFGKMMDVYQGALSVEVIDIIANDDYGVVLTRESGSVDGDRLAWTGVHQFSFDGRQLKRFVNYCSAEYQRYWAVQS
jgi:ketosteroid isomerase-like protein